MSTRPDYVTAIDRLVKGEHALEFDEKNLAVSLAVKKYSKDRPRRLVIDLAGAGAFDFAVSALTGWADEFSAVLQVEYPVDDTDETPDILDEEQWMIYQKPAGKVLRLTDETPAVGESVRVTYTALHTCTDAASSVPGIDEDAVQTLAASYFCDMLAAYHAQTAESTIQADAVDHRSQAAEYARRADKFAKIYGMHLGIVDGRPAAASHTKDWDVNYPGGADRLTHPRRQR